MIDDELVQEALFQIESPDGDVVWACSPGGRDIWCRNLGPTEKVAELMSQWLGSIDFDERESEMHYERSNRGW